MIISNNAIEYTVRRILDIACPGISKEFIVERNRAKLDNKYILFSLSDAPEIKALIDGTYQMGFIKSAVGDNDVPVMMAESEFGYIEGNTLTVNADIITLPFLLLSRMEETFTEDRDQYNRFSYYSSLAYKYSFIDIPIVDEYAMILRRCIIKLMPDTDLGVKKGRVIPTHDIDTIRRFRGIVKSAKSLVGGDLFLRKNPRIFIRSFKQYLKSANNPHKDPEILGALKLLELSKDNGLTSEFYFMGYSRAEKGYTYDPSSPSVVSLIHKIHESGMIVGIHGGFNSCDHVEVFSRHKKNIEQVNGSAVQDGRQHYLCFNAVKSPLVWQRGGLKRDLTLSFHDHEGFRCGTCHEYPLYDIEGDRELEVLEQPLIVMDDTLRTYRKLSKEEAKKSICNLYSKCMSVEGNFVILWHNSSVFRDYEDWYKDVYESFIREFHHC